MGRSTAIKISVSDKKRRRIFYIAGKGKLFLGYNPKNHIQVFGSGVPAGFPFVENGRNGVFLNIQEDMSGQIIAGDCPLDIQDLLKHQLLSKSKNGYKLPLLPGKQAHIYFKDLELDIEFDGKAPGDGKEIGYWKLTRRLSRRLKSDLLFKAILSVLLLLGVFIGHTIQSARLKPRTSVNLEKYTRHVARILIRPQKPAKDMDLGRKVASSAKDSQIDNNDSSSPAEKSKSAELDKAEAARKAVMKKGLLGLIAGKGTGSKSGTVIDALVDRGLVRELDELLQSTENLEVELPSVTDIGGDLNQLLSTTPQEVDKLISGTAIDDGVELKEKGEVSLEQFGDISGSESALGWRSEQSIRDDILKYMGRVQFIYKRFLKLDPELKGKVVMEIVIESSGEVSSCRILESTVGNRDFENELIKVVKSFRFRPIPEGQVAVQNPFIFYRTDL